MGRRGKQTIKYPSKETLDHHFKKDVLDHPEFERHIQETAEIMNISPDIVRDVVIHHNRTILHMIGKVRKKSILQIAVYGFLKIQVLLDPLINNNRKKRKENEHIKSINDRRQQQD